MVAASDGTGPQAAPQASDGTVPQAAPQASDGTAPQVVLYSRPGCHLCDDARQALEALRPSLAFSLLEVDIESDPALERRFMLEIPVIEVDGEVVTQAPVNLDAVTKSLGG